MISKIQINCLFRAICLKMTHLCELRFGDNYTHTTNINTHTPKTKSPTQTHNNIHNASAQLMITIWLSERRSEYLYNLVALEKILINASDLHLLPIIDLYHSKLS